jgi:hypothetical protein
MGTIARSLIAAGRVAVGLLIDDGAVALGILIALALTVVLSRPSLLGPSDTLGWLLLVFLWASLAWSLRGAVNQQKGPTTP